MPDRQIDTCHKFPCTAMFPDELSDPCCRTSRAAAGLSALVSCMSTGAERSALRWLETSSAAAGGTEQRVELAQRARFSMSACSMTP